MRRTCGKAGVFVREQVVRVKHRKVVYAVGDILFDEGHIVLHRRGKTAFVQPNAHSHLLFADYYYGVKFGRFETRRGEKGEFQRGRSLFRDKRTYVRGMHVCG